VHLSHPLGVKAFGYRLVKDDGSIWLPRLLDGSRARVVDRTLGDKGAVSMVRHRAKLVRLRAHCKGSRPSLTRRPLNVYAAVEGGPKPQVTKVMTGPASQR
jgi:hypothetical protein